MLWETVVISLQYSMTARFVVGTGVDPVGQSGHLLPRAGGAPVIDALSSKTSVNQADVCPGERQCSKASSPALPIAGSRTPVR